MPLYVGDYLRDTMHLSTEEHGAYLLILMTLWSRGGSLPADRETLAQAARLPARRWAAIGPKIMALLSVEGGAVTQKRLAAELTKDAAIRAKRKEAGELGVIARRLNRRQSEPRTAFGQPGGPPPGPAFGYANGPAKDQPAVGACTCASGSQVWTGHMGSLTAKLAMKARNSQVCALFEKS
jgi:uncharacterized protein YdaU (DUF1376 family)